MLFHYSQHIIAGEQNSVSLRKLAIERYIGLMSLFNKADIVTDIHLEDERFLSKSALMRMRGLDDKWDGPSTVRTAIHYFLANGYSENHTGKGVTKCAKLFGPNGIHSLDALTLRLSRLLGPVAWDMALTAFGTPTGEGSKSSIEVNPDPGWASDLNWRECRFTGTEAHDFGSEGWE